MPITMSDVNIQTARDTADEYNRQSVDYNGNGGAEFNTQRNNDGLFGTRLFGSESPSGAAFAGVTAEFVSAYNTVCDSYKSNITAKIDQMGDVSSDSAFKGSGIQGALSRFVEGVKAVATSYTASLTAVQIQMANAVAQAYATQDTDLAGQMDADTGNLAASSVNIGSGQ